MDGFVAPKFIWGERGETWGNMGKHGETWGNVGKRGETWGNVGKRGETWGNMWVHRVNGKQMMDGSWTVLYTVHSFGGNMGGLALVDDLAADDGCDGPTVEFLSGPGAVFGLALEARRCDRVGVL